MTDLEKLADIVENGIMKEVKGCVSRLLAAGVTPEEIVSHGFMPGLTEVGKKFADGEYFITNMLLSARTVKVGYEVLRPELGDSHIVSHKKVVLGTVQGDLHNIGKSLVAMAIRGVGIEIIDLGVDVPDDTHGVLQDSHWAGGLFGYFPSYALGSAYGAQLLKRMNETIDVFGEVEKGNLVSVREWLSENIWQHGRLYAPVTLMENAFGGAFDAGYYVDYLKEKFEDIYNL